MQEYSFTYGKLKSSAFFIKAAIFLLMGLFIFTVPMRPLPELTGPQRWMTNIPSAFLYILGGIVVLISVGAIGVMAYRVLSGVPALTVSDKGILVPQCYGEFIVWDDIIEWRIDRRKFKKLQIIINNVEYYENNGANLIQGSIVVDLSGVSNWRNLDSIFSHYRSLRAE